jgi:threonine dehydrogenase-like Zn-dependent dehydrogenase
MKTDRVLLVLQAWRDDIEMSKYIESRIVELQGPRNLVIQNQTLDIGALKGNEVAAETIYSAISPGTEVAAYQGDPPLRPSNPYPRVVGYCNVAEIIAKGNSVSEYEVGDKILTFQSHRSAFVCTEESIITKIPDNADLIETTTTYLFHLGYNTLLKGGLKPGHNVAVVSLGTLGLTTVALASLFGARVYAFSNHPMSLELAEAFGARLVFKKNTQNILEAIQKDTQRTGIDIVVTTSNSWTDWKLAISLPRKGGNVCVLGFPGRTEPIPNFNPLDSQFFYDNQLTLIACGYSPDYMIDAHDIRFTIKRNCKVLLDLIAIKKLPAGRIISSVIDWHEIGTVYEIIAGKEVPYLTGVLKWK